MTTAVIREARIILCIIADPFQQGRGFILRTTSVRKEGGKKATQHAARHSASTAQASQSSSKRHCFAFSLFLLTTEVGREEEKQLPRAPAVKRTPEPCYCGIRLVQFFPNKRARTGTTPKGMLWRRMPRIAAGLTLLESLPPNHRLLAILPLQRKPSQVRGEKNKEKKVLGFFL